MAGQGDMVVTRLRPTALLRRVRGWTSQVLLISRVARLAVRTPKDHRLGWERYWGKVRRTGVGGDVLWDSGDLDELPPYVTLMRLHLDMSLPIVDVGCGNGRFTRRLSTSFPSVLGVDLSANAVTLARREASGIAGLTFRALDATATDAAGKIRADIGTDANVFVRGVFHVLDKPGRVALARTLLHVVGSRGRVLLAETNFRGSQLGYLQHLGATAGSIPKPLQRAIADLPRPGHFGELERAEGFPASAWSVVADGPTSIQTIPLGGATEPELIPGYFAIMSPRNG
jgi:SAM-dependent methyltransferase